MPFEDEKIEQIKEDKPFGIVVQNLEMTFGEPKLSAKSDVLEMLVKIILSQATTGTNSRRTFRNLKERFENWDETLRATEKEIADAIRLGGLANQKAKVIKNLLEEYRGKIRKTFARISR